MNATLKLQALFRIPVSRLSVLMLTIMLMPQSAIADWFLDAEANLESDLVIYKSSGLGQVSFDLIRVGVRSDFGFNNSIPNNWAYQDWNGSAWPTTTFSDTQSSPDLMASADSFLDRNSVTDSLPFRSGVFVGGKMNNAIGMSSAVALDFTLNIDANTQGVVELFEANAEIEAINAAPGFGFVGVRLYDPTVDVDDPNGVNFPYAENLISLVDHGSTGQQQLNLLREFDNLNGAGALSLDMRIEIYAVVFTSVPVPEPGPLLAVALLGCVVGLRRRKRIFPLEE